jgi:hypothetical protein
MRSDPSRNMTRFYAMQLGKWLTNPRPGHAASPGTECGKKCTPLTASQQRALRAPRPHGASVNGARQDGFVDHEVTLAFTDRGSSMLPRSV